MKRRWPKLLVIISAGILLCVLAIGIFLHTPVAGRIILSRLNSYLHGSSGIDLDAVQLKINLLTGTVVLHNVSVRSVQAPDLPPIFVAERIQIRPVILDILNGMLSLDDLSITTPRIHYFVRKDGGTNLPVSPRKSSSRTDFLIAHGKLEKGSFKYEDLRRNVRLDLPLWQISIEGKRLTQEHHLDFKTTRHSSASYQGRSFGIGFARFSGVLQKQALQIESLQVGALRSNFSAAGVIEDFSDPALNLHIKIQSNLREISKILGSTEPVGGFVDGTLQTTGKLQGLNIEAHLSGRDVEAINYSARGLKIRTQAEWRAPRLLLRSFELSSPEGLIRGSANLLVGQNGTNSIEAELRDFDLHPAWKQLKAPFDLATRATGKISLKWSSPFSMSTIESGARLSLQSTRSAPAHNLLPVSGTLDVQIKSGQTLGTLRAFSVMGTRIEGTFSLFSFKTVEADIRGEVSDLDPLLKQVSQFTGDSDPTLIGVKTSGQAEFQAKASGMLSNPTITVTANAPDLQADEIKHLKLEAEAKIEDSKVAFEADVTVQQASLVTAQGELDFSKRETALSLDARTEKMPAEIVASTLGSSIPATGTLTANLHLEGPVSSPTGIATLAGEAVTVYGQALGRFKTELKISSGEIQSDRFRIIRDPATPETNHIDTIFGYGISSKRFHFEAAGKGIKWDAVRLPGSKTLSGSANMTASGSGTFEDPEIDAKIDSDDLTLDQTIIGPASVTARLRGGQATIKAAAPKLNATASVRLQDRSPYAYDGELTVRDTDLSLLGLHAPNRQPLTGLLDAVVTASGNLEKVMGSRISVQIKKAILNAGGIEAHTEGPVQAQYSDGLLEIPAPATIVSGSSRLQVEGRVPLEKSAPAGSLTMKGRIDLAQALGFLAAPAGLSATGTLNLDLSLTGTPTQLNPTGMILLEGGIVHLPHIQAPLSNIDILATLKDGSLVLQKANALIGDGKISIQGEFPFGLLPQKAPLQFTRKKGPASFTLDLESFRPEQAGLLQQGMSGLVSLHATGQTTSTDLKDLKTRILFRDLGFKISEIAFGQNGTSTIIVEDGVASISRLSLTGAETNIDVSGSAGLFQGYPLNLRIVGNFDAGLLTFVTKDVQAAGKMQVRVDIGGRAGAPSLSGLAEMTGGRLRLRNPSLVADSLNVVINFTPNKISIQELKGTLNGGSLSMNGTVGYAGGKLDRFDLKATMQDVFMEFPQGLRSSSNGTITIISSDENILIGGNIRVTESSYREPFAVIGQLSNYLKSQRLALANTERSPLLERIRLNVGLRTITPLMVQNNIARLEATGNLTVVGTFYEPSIVGRITLNQGGEIVLNQRTYYIERGIVTLTDQSQIKPELDITAQTKVDVYDVTMHLTGPPERPLITLTSEPSLPEPDIMSLLLTGKVSSQATQQVARTQALALIAGQAGEEVTSEARQALHLSTLRIDPGGLIASESDLGARLTIGEDITNKLSLAYSMNLVDGGQQIWAAQYKVTRKLTTQATKQQDNSYRFEFRHDLQLGGAPGTRRTRNTASQFQVGSVKFEGDNTLSRKVLLDRFKIEPGERYEFPKVQKGLDRLHDLYAEQDRLEAEIRLHRETDEKTVNLDVTIEPGPIVEFLYTGMPISDTVKGEVEKAWRNGVFDIERLDDAVEAIRRPLIREGYLQAKIRPEIKEENDKKIVQFQIEPGTRYSNIPVLFPGASELEADDLSGTIKRANLGFDIYANPQKVADFLRQFYQERGYLKAQVDLPKADLDPNTGTGKVVIPIREGPLFTIGELSFNGNSAFTYDQLWMVIPTSSGSIYNPQSMLDAIRAIESLYHGKGYNDVTIAYGVAQDSKAAQANVTFQISERKQSVIREIVIEGNRETSRDFVERQLDFSVDDALDNEKFNVTRKRLYSTGVYSSVEFQNEEIAGAPATPRQKDIRVRIRVREVRPYRLQYGFFYDTDRGPGGLLEAQDLLPFGRASTLGARLRYDSDLKEARLYFNQPFVENNFPRMDIAAFGQREDRAAFKANRLGFSLIREKTLPKKYILNYGYRYDHVRWQGLPPDPTIFQASNPVARLLATITRDTRDSILDATRGEFTSHSFEFGPSWLGSDIGFSRYSGQYFRYVPLDRYLGKATKDKEGKPLPASLVYAGAVRLGLTSAFGGQDLISPERFFAGGGTTMRGFQQDLLGPTEIVDVDGTLEPRPIGGEAMFLFNNELRFPIISIFQGVGFVDIGNVYRRISDFNFSLRKSAGLGLRIKIKYIPLRFDYGFKLDRRPGESKGEFFFSIGQAF